MLGTSWAWRCRRPGRVLSASPNTPEQLVEKLVYSVKSSDLDGDELRALVGEIITSVTNQLYEIIKERES